MSLVPLLQAKDIVKELGQGQARVVAVNGVNLTLNSGEFALLMGPSGSGKSSLVLAGLIPALRPHD